MTPIELHRLAGAIACLRPEWPATSLHTFIAKHFTHRPLRDVAVALTYVACDSASTSPGRVLEAGPWWHAAATTDHPTVTNDCRIHSRGEFRVPMRIDPKTGDSICSGCYVDRHENPDATATFRRQTPSAEARRIARGATPDTATGAAQ